MKNGLESLFDLLAISACAWGIYGLYAVFSVKKFIVKRYEEETNLCNTVFFAKHMTFTKFLPGSLSVSLYSSHLMTFVWGWRYVKFIKEKRPKVTYYSDIDSPERVTSLFSDKEIGKVKLMTICLIILFFHGVAYYIFRAIWPEVFK